MKIQLPPAVRATLYIVISILTPVVAFLGNNNKLSDFWVQLYAVVVTAVAALAFKNVN